jgi:hypothetical protein
LTGGKWLSSYDGIKYSDASKLDIDHLVPLAEAWRLASAIDINVERGFKKDAFRVFTAILGGFRFLGL